MIEPVARCMACCRDVFSKELTTWSRNRTDECEMAWWGWQVLGRCAGCTKLEYEIALEEAGEVINDGCSEHGG